jgi:hypothetical protein
LAGAAEALDPQTNAPAKTKTRRGIGLQRWTDDVIFVGNMQNPEQEIRH